MTSKILWVGSQAPPDLEQEFEIHLPVSSSQMVDLGRPYLLLDVPGHNDGIDPVKQAAWRSLALSPLRVFVTHWDTMEAASTFEYLSRSDGTTILPVVVDDQHLRALESVNQETQALGKRLKEACPSATILSPAVIPHIDRSQQREAAARKAEALIHGAVREALTNLVVNEERMTIARLARLRRELRHALRGFVEKVEPRFEALEEAEAQAARSIVEQLVGTDRQLSSGVRLQLLTRTAAAVPLVYFPFRTFMGTLTLTAGALDRLLLGFTGSFPSLAMAAFQTAKNLRRLEVTRSTVRTALQQRARELATAQVHSANMIFHRAIEHALPEGARQRVRGIGSETKLEGLHELENESARIIGEQIEQSVAPKGVPYVMGLIGTVLFMGLLAGPVWATYRAYLAAWSGTFASGQPGAWHDYPVLSAGMWFTTMVLVMAPPFFLAAIALSIGVTDGRVRRCVQAIRTALKSALDRMLTEKKIFLRTEDPIRQAVRSLIEFCRIQQNRRSRGGIVQDPTVSLPASQGPGAC